MSNSFFKFKEFTIWHDRCAMKVGTDSTLLGSWVNVDGAKKVLDIGTGTGLLALMIAQRSDAELTAIEIDIDAASQARDNIHRSPWESRILLIHDDFTKWAKEATHASSFDLIVSNPPYYVDSLPNPDSKKKSARHNSDLNYGQLIDGVDYLLNAHGAFYVITPTPEYGILEQLALKKGLCPAEQLWIHTKVGKQPKRVITRFTKDIIAYSEKHLSILNEEGQYSEEYIKLTSPYYIRK